MNYACRTLIFISVIILCTQCSKSTTDPEPEPPVVPTVNVVAVWATKGDKTNLLTKKDSTSFVTESSSSVQIDINTNTSYQEIDGFGAALTGSSAFVINSYLSAAERDKLLKDLFTKQGIGIEYLRLTIGSSDFSSGNYTYNSSSGDTLMNDFSLALEMDNLIPVLKEIVAINPQLKILATPWSAPAWMKTNNSLVGGHLKMEYYRAYARYFVRYIKAMKAEGIAIDAVSVQNEPLHGTAAYPCMYMYASEQRVFIGDFLGPMFKDQNIDTKIIAYDHNWDEPNYGDSVLNYPAAAEYVDGTAFHAYAGNVSAMSILHDLHPGKNLYFTEISGGGWAPLFRDNLPWYMENIIIGTMRNHSKNALFWNLALDENDGPTNNGCADCRGVVTITSAGAVIKNEEYYAIGHAGKFIQRGAKRVQSNDFSTQLLHNVAFVNPDGSKVLIVLNNSVQSKNISVKAEGKQFTYPLESNAVYTFVW